MNTLKKVDYATAFTYWFAHFSVEVICFYILETVFGVKDNYQWCVYIAFDTIAFATQPLIGTFCEQHPKFRPGLFGDILLIFGGAFTLIFKSINILNFIGLVIFTFGNALIHVSGAISTGRVSEGRMSESAIFVGGGSFGVITGRLLAGTAIPAPLIFLPALISFGLMYLADKRIRTKYGETAFDFSKNPVKHDVAADRPAWSIILILGLIVVARGYIGYGLPTAWNVLKIHLVFLFVFMGFGKMLGGILSDALGPKKVGIISSLLALPVLLVSNNIMWLSLIGIALFSMTMAITLGGLFSVMRYTPGTAFGVTTIGLLMGSLPLFFVPMPAQNICNILNAILSVFAATGIWYCISDKNYKFGRRKNDDLFT